MTHTFNIWRAPLQNFLISACWKKCVCLSFILRHFELRRVWVVQPLRESALPLSKCLSCWKYFFSWFWVFIFSEIPFSWLKGALSWKDDCGWKIALKGYKLLWGKSLSCWGVLLLGVGGTILKQSCSTSWFTQREKCSTLEITILHHNDYGGNFAKFNKSLSLSHNFSFLLCASITKDAQFGAPWLESTGIE